ncbi:MAG: carboxylesterase family protein [Armatimonadota bacterium]
MISSSATEEILLRNCLVVRQVVSANRRSVLHSDPIEALIVAGKWSPPKAGDAVIHPNGTRLNWETVTAGKDGSFHHPAMNGGYAYTSVETPVQKVMLLEAAGHSMVYVNGVPRTGDVYGYGYTRLPVLLRKGNNDLLFLCGRGSLRAKLTTPKSSAMLDTSDLTLPDIIAGKPVKTMGAAMVTNFTDHFLTNCSIKSTVTGGQPVMTRLPSIPPYGIRKVPFKMIASVLSSKEKCNVNLALMETDGLAQHVMDTASFDIGIKPDGSSYKKTFISKIDGSLQYYAVTPRLPGTNPKLPPALVLTLHGASVEAIGQVSCYERKSWAYIVAPTNRRPYGFDWEGIGAMDALEVLDLAQAEFKTDPQRTYLTGHSMGGHGTWHMGVTWPDRFAAIGPSSGWISFFSYGGSGRNPAVTPSQEIMMRAMNPSDTLALAGNYTQQGIYALHGDADDNVPVTEMRGMVQKLSTFHKDFAWHEVAGAGHWYDGCVDWAPMFDLFTRHRIPTDAEVRQVDFVTANPGVSAKCHWATIEAQLHPLALNTISLRCDPGQSRFTGTTANVARLALDVSHLKSHTPVSVELDGQKLTDIPTPASKTIYLSRSGDKWSVTPASAASVKGPRRSGPFKRVLNNRLIFVYGTKGTPEQNEWSLAKARYDAETLWYRGNGAVDIVADTKFRLTAERDRNVMLYGNSETNSAWSALLPACPVQVKNGSVIVGGRVIQGDELACMFIQPRAGSDVALVGVISGSGIAGMRLTDRISYINSGVELPDCLVLGPETLSNTSSSPRAAGFFGNDWQVSSGDFAYRE